MMAVRKNNNMTNQLAKMETGKDVAAIIPTNTTEVESLAVRILEGKMAPRGMDTPQKITAAIIAGLEAGLNPMQAVNSIAVINGRPTMWGDAVLAVALASDKIKDLQETIEGSGDNMKAVCSAHRKGFDNPTVREFSVIDAKTANLWGKQGPWKQYPKRMLQMRARAFALRDAFPDVLAGIHIREEVQDYQSFRSEQETKAVSVEEMKGEPEKEEEEEAEEAEVVDIITAEEATDFITRATNAETLDEFLIIRKEIVDFMVDKADSPLKKSVRDALETKTKEFRQKETSGALEVFTEELRGCMNEESLESVWASIPEEHHEALAGVKGEILDQFAS